MRRHLEPISEPPWKSTVNRFVGVRDPRRAQALDRYFFVVWILIGMAVAFDHEGRLWVGTSLGVARLDDRRWSLRHSHRWLPDDEVRDMAFGRDGSAWVATRGGIGVLRRRTLTLADKADYFQHVVRTRHVRPPGLVERCRLRVPGDLTTWEPMDTDNDGSYTGVYSRHALSCSATYRSMWSNGPWTTRIAKTCSWSSVPPKGSYRPIGYCPPASGRSFAGTGTSTGPCVAMAGGSKAVVSSGWPPIGWAATTG